MPPPSALIRGSGPEQMFVRNNLLFVTMLHSDKVEVFKINQTPTDVSQVLTQAVSISPEGSRPREWKFHLTEKQFTWRISRRKTSRFSASTPTAN